MTRLQQPVFGKVYEKVHVATGKFVAYVKIVGKDTDSFGEAWYYDELRTNIFMYVGKYHNSEDIYPAGTLAEALFE